MHKLVSSGSDLKKLAKDLERSKEGITVKV